MTDATKLILNGAEARLREIQSAKQGRVRRSEELRRELGKLEREQGEAQAEEKDLLSLIRRYNPSTVTDYTPPRTGEDPDKRPTVGEAILAVLMTIPNGSYPEDHLADEVERRIRAGEVETTSTQHRKLILSTFGHLQRGGKITRAAGQVTLSKPTNEALFTEE